MQQLNCSYSASYSIPLLFNLFQAKDPQTDGAMEQGPPYYI